MIEKPEIQIYVACHKPTYVLDNCLLIPIQVGAELTQTRYEGMQYDNVGENISYKNTQYCELTAQYWAWKNVECEYYGFFHYRRYMSFADIYPVLANGMLQKTGKLCPYIEVNDIHEDLTKYRFDESIMKAEIQKYDLITVLREKINTTVYRQYCQYHKPEYIECILTILKKKYPEYEQAVQKYMNSKEIYYMNMYIMKKTLFHEYMEWLFDILKTFEEELKNLEIELEPRSMGYLAERLFGIFYIYQMGHGIKCAEVPYLKFYNTEFEPNTTVQSNDRIFYLKPLKIRIKIDMRKLNRLFPAGSRRRIWLRSIFLH